MKILCAVDFTAPSRLAANAAADLALKLGATLHLVHVAHLPGVGTGRAAAPMSVSPDELARLRQLLAREAESIDRPRLKVVQDVLEGLPDERINEHATAIGAEFVVIGPTGARRPFLFGLGSIASRLIKTSSLPVMIVREHESTRRWSEGESLRVAIGLDASRPARAALGWLGRLRKSAAFELVAVQIDVPVSDLPRPPREERERELEAHVKQRLARTSGLASSRVRIAQGNGSVADRLVEIVESENAHLLVVGTHRRPAWSKRVMGSVALDIVSRSNSNVVVVPLSPQTAELAARPRTVRRVLVPTDRSPHSKLALAWACELLPRGGTLHVVHVLRPAVSAFATPLTAVFVEAETRREDASSAGAIEEELRASIPSDAAEKGLEVEVELVSGFDPAHEIARASERCDADLICLTTHGSSGLSRAMLGSVAAGVVREALVPVVVVPPPDVL